MGGVPVLRLSGEVDIASVARLRPTWLELADATAPALVVVDLAGVTFMDVAGLGLLVGLRNRLQQHGGQVHLRHVPDRVSKLMELTGLAGLFPVERTPRQRAPGPVIDLRLLEGEPQVRDL
jgi:stage II sporulation protein AA (anti-sigma F factor antagonist)